MEARNPYSKEWVIGSEYGQEKVILREMPALIAQTGLHSDRIEDMLTVVAEACLNAFEHGNRHLQHLSVRVKMTIDERMCSFRVSDEGRGFLSEPSLLRNGEEEFSRGWGMFLMKALADRWACGYCRGKFYVEMEFLHTG